MRKVEALPSGRWKVRFRGPLRGGKSGQTSETFETKREAVQFAKWLDALGPQGAIDRLYEQAQDEAVPTLDELAADHIAHLTGIEEGTRKTYTRLWARTWGPLVGSTQAHHVTRDQLATAVNALALHYAAKSLQNQRGLLAAVLDRAVEHGHLAKNPAKGLRLPRTGEAEREEMRILTPEEFAGVLERMAPGYRGLVMFLAGTGARWGEAVALRAGDWRPPNVRIQRALKWSPDNNRVIGPTKTRRSKRMVTVGQALAAVLDEACAGKAPGDLVFTAPRGGAVLHRTFWSRAWLPAVSHLEPRPRIHDLRHTHASWLLAAGVPIHVVSLRLGHETIKTTVDTYGHLLPDAQAAAAAAAELAFSPAAIGPRVD